MRIMTRLTLLCCLCSIGVIHALPIDAPASPQPQLLLQIVEPSTASQVATADQKQLQHVVQLAELSSATTTTAADLAAATTKKATAGGGGSSHSRRPAEGVEFPNTAFIPGDLTEQLSVDGFFSLWFVFLDDDVFTSDKEFTILAPSNSAPTRPSPTAADKDRVRQLLLNHIVLGRAVNISSDLSTAAAAKRPLTLTTLGGKQLHFKTSRDGAAVVNGVRIVGHEVAVPTNGVVVVLEDYLFMGDYHGDVEASESQLFSTIPMVTSSDGGDHFPMIELGTHDHHDADGGAHLVEAVHQEHIGSVLIHRQKLMLGAVGTNASRPFYDELLEVLNFLRSGTSDFLRYLEQANISSLFLPEEEYTAFIPMDDSFAQWYPIDWGFNPFDVESFVKETILNHFIAGRFKQKDVVDGHVAKTLGGKSLTFSTTGKDGKLMVNDVEVFDGDTPVSRGNIHFIGDLLFVNASVVRQLNAKHRDVESAPLVTSPWYSSQFLSHTYRELSSRQPSDFQTALDYVNRTQPQLRDDLPSHDGWKMMTYTFFVPRDSAFINLWPQDTADPFVIDDDFRRDVFLNHFVRRRLYHERDLIDGALITMAGNLTAKISREGNVTKINDAVIEESDIFIYNLGTVFVIDRVLFVSQERISQVLAKNADRIPSFAFAGPDGATAASSSSFSPAGSDGDDHRKTTTTDASLAAATSPDSTTDAVDLLDETTTTESTAGKLVIRE